jgi:putative membrane protein
MPKQKMKTTHSKHLPLNLLLGTIVVALTLLWSSIAPYDRATWWMEVAPVLLVYPVLWMSRRSFVWTDLLYILIMMHALVLIVGGAYTYARVPFGFWLQDLLGDSRNPYDKIGHFMQGFVPALAAREWLWRRGWVTSLRVASALAVCVAMTLSAVYELLEWLAAVLLGQGADEFLGTQGYVWDTQSDMGFALLGALMGVVLLSTLHNRQMNQHKL